MLEDPGRVKYQITSVMCQILVQRFDFERNLSNLVVTQKLIIRIPPGLGLNPQ